MNMKMKLFSYNTRRHAHSPAFGSDQIDLLSVPHLCGDVFVRYPRHPGGDGIFHPAHAACRKIQFSQIRLMVIYVLIFIVTNAVISFFFSPEYGT